MKCYYTSTRQTKFYLFTFFDKILKVQQEYRVSGKSHTMLASADV